MVDLWHLFRYGQDLLPSCKLKMFLSFVRQAAIIRTSVDQDAYIFGSWITFIIGHILAMDIPIAFIDAPLTQASSFYRHGIIETNLHISANIHVNLHKVLNTICIHNVSNYFATYCSIILCNSEIFIFDFLKIVIYSNANNLVSQMLS